MLNCQVLKAAKVVVVAEEVDVGVEVADQMVMAQWKVDEAVAAQHLTVVTEVVTVTATVTITDAVVMMMTHTHVILTTVDVHHPPWICTTEETPMPEEAEIHIMTDITSVIHILQAGHHIMTDQVIHMLADPLRIITADQVRENMGETWVTGSTEHKKVMMTHPNENTTILRKLQLVAAHTVPVLPMITPQDLAVIRRVRTLVPRVLATVVLEAVGVLISRSFIIVIFVYIVYKYCIKDHKYHAQEFLIKSKYKISRNAF